MGWGDINRRQAARRAKEPALVRTRRKPRHKHRQGQRSAVRKHTRISLRTGLLEAVEPRLEVNEALDAQQARQFARILASGCRLEDVPYYLLPNVDPKRAWDLVKRWAVSPLLVDALNEFNRGAWPDIDKNDRLALAVDQSNAQMARFIYTARFDTLQGPDLKKYMEARAALVAHTTGLNDRGDFLDAFHTFLSLVGQGKAALSMPQTINMQATAQRWLPEPPT